MEDRVCNECGRFIEPNELAFCVRLEMFAEPKVTFTEEDLEDDVQSGDRWQKFIQELEDMSDDDVREANNQVYEKFAWLLCGNCRRDLHQRIKQHKKVAEG